MYGTPTWRASRMCSRVCGNGAIGGGHDQNRAVHLRGAGDHVLDVIGVTRAVHVRVVTVGRLVLDVGGGDRYAARLLLGGVVDLIERLHIIRATVVVMQHLGDGGP